MRAADFLEEIPEPASAADFLDAKPSASFGDGFRDAAATALKIGPTAVKGVVDIGRLLTGDSIGVDLSKDLARRMQVIDEVVGSDALRAQKAALSQALDSPDVGISDLPGVILDNPRAALDIAGSSIGSMFLPAGVAAGTARALPTIARLFPALGRVAPAAAVTGTTIGTTAAQNASETFTDTEGQPLDERFKGAGISAAASLALGKLLGGGAEGVVARRLAGEAAGRGVGQVARSVAATSAKEFLQEGGEEGANAIGKQVALGQELDPNAVGKQALLGGTIGLGVGGASDLATSARGLAQGRAESQIAAAIDQAAQSIADTAPPQSFQQPRILDGSSSAQATEVTPDAASRVLQAIEQAQNVQNAPPAPRAEAQATADQAPAAKAVDAAAAAGVPAEPAATRVEAAGLTAEDFLAQDAATVSPVAQDTGVPNAPQAPQAELQSAAAPQQAPANQIIGQNGNDLAEGGRPFRTRLAAQVARDSSQRVVRVQGGFALKPKTDLQLAAEARAARRLTLPSFGNRGVPQSAHEFIAAQGGLSPVARSELRIQGNPRIGNRTLFAAQGRGLSIEQAAQRLAEAGFIRSEDHNTALETIRRSLTQPQFTPEGVEQAAQSEVEQRFEDFLAAQQESQNNDFLSPESILADDDFSASDLANTGFREAGAALRAEVAALVARANDLGIDAESILERVATQTADQSEGDFNAAAKQQLQDAIAERTGSRGASQFDGNGPGGEGRQAQPAGNRDSGQDNGQESAPAGDFLTSPTRQDVERQQDRAAQVEAERTAADAKAKREEAEAQDRKEIARRSETAADTFELGQSATDNLSGQQSVFDTSEQALPLPSPRQFSVAGRPLSPEARALDEIRKNTDLFQRGRSEETTVEAIAAELEPDFTVKRKNDAVGRTEYTITLPSGEKGTLTVRPFNKFANDEAPTIFGFDLVDGEMSNLVTERPGTNPEDVGPIDDVWIDVSGVKEGGMGGRIYNIAANFAHNTGRIFIGDPAGLSDSALRRRTEQMLSSALKFGTTQHLGPHPRQVAGDKALGVPPLRWTYGDDVGNIRALIQASQENFNRDNPITFEPGTGRYLDSEGAVLDDDAISLIADAPGPARTLGAGLATLKRGALFDALGQNAGREASGPGRERAGLLEKLVVLARELPESVRRVFYSRNTGAGQDSAANSNTSDGVRRALSDRFGPLIGRLEQRGTLKIWDTVQQFNAEAKSSDRIDGAAQGLWDGKTAHLFADGIETGNEIGVFLHEVGEHASMRQMLGPQRYTSLTRRANALTQLKDPVALEAQSRIPQATPEEHRDSELLAYMVEVSANQDAKASPSASRLVADIVAAIRAWWFTTGLSQRLEKFGVRMDLTPNDIAALAVRGIEFQARQRGDAAGERLDTPKTSIPASASKKTNAPTTGGTTNNAGGVVAPKPFSVSEPGTGDAFIRTIQDNKIDLKRVRDAIEKDYGSRLKDAQDAYLNEELYHGKVAARVDALYDQQITPILAKISVAGQNSGVTLDDVNQYLHARHAPERNAAMKAINPGTPNNDALSGMSDTEAAKVLADFRANGKGNALALIAKDIDQLLADTRTNLVADGLEDAAVVQAWESAYQHYVPLQRDVASSGTPKGQGFSVRGPESKRAVGSNKEVVNILANIVAQAETAAIRAEKAVVGRSLLQMARDFPNPDFWQVDVAPTQSRINKYTGLVERNAINPLFKSADNVLVVKSYGAEHFIVFNKDNERAMAVAKAMKNLDIEPVGKTLQMVSKGTRFIASLLTQRNPIFWATNFSRDIQGALIQLGGTDAEGLQRQVLENMPKAFEGMRSLVRGDGSGQWARFAKEFKDAGGSTGFMQTFADSNERMKDLQKEVDRMRQGKADPRRLARTALDFIDDYNDIVENSVRLAVFQAARESGASTARAASVAKNITTNFNRKGNLTPTVNALYMFFNASVQGTARIGQAIATSKSARIAVGGLAVAGFLLDIFNRMAVGDDDETKRNRYDLIPEFDKARNWIFMNPMRPGEFIKVPLPLGPHVFHNAGRLLADSIHRKNPRDAVEYGWALGGTLIDAFSPLGPAASFGQLLAPSLLDPVVQLAENKSFTGGPVFKSADRFGAKDPAPAYTRFFETTPEFWRAASKSLNDITGGDKVKAGFINVEPDIFRHVFQSVTGGPGRALDQAIDSAQAGARGQDLSVNRIPLVNRFVGEIDDKSRDRAFFSEKKRVADAKTQFDYFIKHGRTELAREVAKELGNGDESKGRVKMLEFSRADKSVRKINAQIQRELAREEDDPQVKAEQLRGLRQRRSQVISAPLDDEE